VPDAYVAPAARVLTFLRKPSDAAPGTDWLTGVATDGRTLCGRWYLLDELWMPVEYRPGDAICPACEAAASGEAVPADVQEALL
jgi:hypothetical protein